VLTDLKTRGVKDAFFVVCDGLKGLPHFGGGSVPGRDRSDLRDP
jgi:transposase-like protein